MAFETQESKSYKKYTGVNKVKVVAINPTLEELNKLGVGFKEEPVYIREAVDDKPKSVTVNFWTKLTVDGEDVLTPVKFFVSDKIEKSERTGKTNFINELGQNQWSESPMETQYFEVKGVREAYVGEVSLINFMKNWLNVRKGGKATLDVTKLLAGDFSELKAINSDNNIYQLFTVYNDQYQNIWNGFIVRGFVDIEDAKEKFKIAIDKQKEAGYPLKEDWSIEFKEWVADQPDMDEQAPEDELPF